MAAFYKFVECEQRNHKECPKKITNPGVMGGYICTCECHKEEEE